MIALIAIKPIRGKTFILFFEQSPFSQTISFMILPITSSMSVFTILFDIRVNQLNALSISTIDFSTETFFVIIRLWL